MLLIITFFVIYFNLLTRHNMLTHNAFFFSYTITPFIIHYRGSTTLSNIEIAYTNQLKFLILVNTNSDQ